jgi:spore coat protein U-like protein
VRCASWALIALLAATATAWAAPRCDITAQGPNFGLYDTLSGSPTDAVGTILVSCDPGIPYSIEMEVSQLGAGGAREMKQGGGGARATYFLYTDSARTRIWGNGSGGTYTVTGVGNGAAQQVPVYGRVPPGQTPPFGTYGDSVQVRVQF